MAFAAPAVQADVIVAAEYAEPTTRYGHGVLGDTVEWGALVLKLGNPHSEGLLAKADVRTAEVVIRLPIDHVFEDIAPRLADVDGDGTLEVLAVETDVQLGAQLAIYDARGRKVAATPHIGTTHRWLAPIGVGDFDGDGFPEIAYIDRPHLAKTLRIWRLKDGDLTEIAQVPGLTNHRIGEDFITSGIRDCGQGAEIVTVDAAWTRIMASRLENDKITSRGLGRFTGLGSVEDALACR